MTFDELLAIRTHLVLLLLELRVQLILILLILLILLLRLVVDWKLILIFPPLYRDWETEVLTVLVLEIGRAHV